MKRKLIVLHHIPIDYSISGPIRFMVRMFNNLEYKKILSEQYNFEVITSLDIQSTTGLNNKQFVKNIKNNEQFKDAIIFAIHPGGFSGIHATLGDSKNVKYIIWQDDLHYFSNFAKDNTTSKQKYCGKFTCPILDKVDYLVTPSRIYFQNLGISDYDNKIIDFFYFLDSTWFDNLRNQSYLQRHNQVILSGSISGGYKSRQDFYALKTLYQDFDSLIYKLDRPTKHGERVIIEMNYYNKLSEFKGAFVGHHEFPINFCLAKHIEVLMCGCLGFYEPNPLLESQLGLKEYIHYVPCYDKGKLIENHEFYKNWMSSKEGEKIAKAGQEFVINTYGNRQIEKLFRFFQEC